LKIRFELRSTGRVSAQILDLAGHRVRTLATDHEYPPGPQVLGWDGKSDAGVGLPSGVYFVEVREGTHSEARRAVLLH
jgi:flagellar hook assembly protein FlgD